MPRKLVNNIKLSYHTIGSGVPIVFIAGLGMDHMCWLYQIPDFQQHFQLVLPDNRGMGQSTGSDDQYTTALMADDIAGLLNQLNIDNAHIIGSSMGGMIAQEFALRHPEMVNKLLLCSTFAKHPEMITYLKQGLNQLGNRKKNDLSDLHADSFTFGPVYDFFLKQVFDETYFKMHESMITNTLQRFIQQDLFVETFLKQLHAIFHHDTLNQLSQITADTLVLTGNNDRLVPTNCTKILAEKIPNATLSVIDGATHVFHIEQPELFNHIIHLFLQNKSIPKHYQKRIH
ncbi:MAG TPA: alpha/beta hydrolase [Candidatus Thermoplasmatota archaeon]|nr:alpha/beta hydrolase [Candidatus Thermoplasmatota archaeon]